MSDAKFMTKQYSRTRRNMSKSGAKAFKKAQTQAGATAASMFPIGRLMGGVGKAYKVYKMRRAKLLNSRPFGGYGRQRDLEKAINRRKGGSN